MLPSRASPAKDPGATPSGGRTRSLPRLEAFDTLRLLCALHIMALHLFQDPMRKAGLPDVAVVALASTAGLSTTIFFMLSGFVIAYSATLSGRRPGPIKPMFRLYPLYFAATSLWFFGTGAFHSQDLGGFLRSLLLLNPFLAKYPADPCAPAWAMTTFALGYAMNAMIVPGLAKLPAHRLRLWLGIALAALTLRGVVSGWIMSPRAPAYPVRMDTLATEYLHIFPLVRLPDILVGTLCGVLTAREISLTPATRWFRAHGWELTLAGLWIGCTALCLTNGRLAFAATHGLLAVPLGLWFLRSADSRGGLFARLGGVIREHLDISAEIYLLHTFVASVLFRTLWLHWGLSAKGREMTFAFLAAGTVLAVALTIKFVSRRFGAKEAARRMEKRAKLIRRET